MSVGMKASEREQVSRRITEDRVLVHDFPLAQAPGPPIGATVSAFLPAALPS
jgi:hypothetical protein